MISYRGRLVSKNQMTIPAAMQEDLGMVQGDELEFVIEGGGIVGAHVLKPVRVDLLPDEVLEMLKQRKASPGSQRKLTAEELRNGVEEKEAVDRSPARVAARF
jgi:antitoxin component of MazEF toxin-antitoxin module